MKKQGGLKIVLMTALLTPVLLQSSAVQAQTIPNPVESIVPTSPTEGGSGIMGTLGSIFGGDRATKTEQLTQITIATTQMEYLLQMLENVAIGNQIATIFGQMADLGVIVETVVGYEVPEKFTQEYEILTDKEYANLRDEREAYLDEIDAEISELEAEITLNENQLDTLMMASTIAEDPPSDIIIGQAQFLGEASRLEQQRRETALGILRAKREEIRTQLTTGDNEAHQAALRCVRTCR